MATNFPTSLDSFVDPQGNQSLNNPPHSAQHANANDAILALQTKVGVDSSTDPTSLDYIANNAVPTTAVGAPNGVAALDSNGLVAIGELPVAATVLIIPGNFSGVVPSTTVGLNGDYALDVSTFKLWGPKALNAWPGSPIATLTHS